MAANALYYGDDLDVLLESVASESVDLVYSNPPFNTQATNSRRVQSKVGVGA